MSRPRRLRWDLPESPPPKHPYRDSALVYGAFAVIIVVVAWLTGGDLTHAVEIAVAFFVIVYAYSAVRWRKKLREQARAEHEAGTEQ